MSLLTSALLWPFAGGVLVLENTLLVPHFPSLVYFGSFFVFGYMAHHYRDCLNMLARNVFVWATFALVLFPVARVTSLLDAGGGDIYRHVFAVLANGTCTWILIAMFVGTALRFFDRDSPWIQYLSQAAYWVFLVLVARRV